MYNIQPITISIGSTSKTATKVDFISSYSPFESTMPFSYTYYTETDEVIYDGSSVLGEAVLAGWGENDEYIINAMATNVGVTIIW